MSKAGILPEDLDAVISSHGHPDHTGNDNLFGTGARTFYNLIITDGST